MASRLGPSAPAGLERSCDAREWVRGCGPVEGVELLRAWFRGRAFSRHRHDTYAIGVTEAGVQVFDYRGRVERCVPGDVVVLHPDEAHDGRAGGADGFGYRIVYVEPARIAAAVRALRGGPAPLPFAREPVSRNPTLARAVTAAFQAPAEPLALDVLVLRLAEGLIEGDSDSQPTRAPRLDQAAGSRVPRCPARDRVLRRALGGHGPEPLRAGPPVPDAVRDEPVPLLAPATARLRTRPPARGEPPGGPGAGGGLC